jgi:mannose-6-phosphate isomerase-like protein (cupin superfamily)
VGLRRGGQMPFAADETPGPGMQLRRIDLEALQRSSAPFRMSSFSLTPGARSPRDVHSEKEIWMIAAGAGDLTFDDATVMGVSAGDVLDLPARCGHSLLNTGTGPLLVFSVWWD